MPLAAEFDTTLATIQWVATGYTLALATVIPLSGWAADRFGTKRLYMGSIALFMIGSAVAGLATLVSLLLPRTKPEPIDDPDGPEARPPRTRPYP